MAIEESFSDDENNFENETKDNLSEDNLAEDSIIPFDKMETSNNTGKKVTAYTWKVTGKRYPIISSETVTYQVRRTINHNLSNGYTLVTLVGKSGTGKTTLTTTWLHRLHKTLARQGQHYAITWHEKMDIARMNDIIGAMTKGINRIIVVDDASYGDRDLEERDAEQLMADLTYVRHTLQANVIFVLIMHYSKALGPFLRDGDVSMFTSISPIERENLIKQFGPDSKRIIKQFFTKYGSMVAENFWYSNLGIDQAANIINYTKKPFKLALVNDFGMLHFMNYPEESCPYCEKRLTTTIKELPDSIGERDLIKMLIDSYGPSRAKSGYRIFFWSKGINVLDPMLKGVMNRISQYYETHKEDFENVANELTLTKSIDRVFRARGIIKGDKTRDELKAESRFAKAKKGREYYHLKKQLEESGPTRPATVEGLEAAGVHSMEAGPMSDEEITEEGDN